jgi:hypothetical protein
VSTREYAPKNEIAASFEAAGSPWASKNSEWRAKNDNIKSARI